MDSLRSIATSRTYVPRQTSKGTVSLECLRIRFERVKAGKPVPDLSDLSRTYTSKPLVRVDNEILFGELAILRSLKDEWNGVWVDAFHSRGGERKFWSSLEDRGCAKLPSHALDLFEKIIAKNEGKLSGFSNVFAWKVRGDDYLFIEYKGKGDHANKNELKWIEAAISVGVKPEQLVIVTY